MLGAVWLGMNRSMQCVRMSNIHNRSLAIQHFEYSNIMIKICKGILFDFHPKFPPCIEIYIIAYFSCIDVTRLVTETVTATVTVTVTATVTATVANAVQVTATPTPSGKHVTLAQCLQACIYLVYIPVMCIYTCSAQNLLL